MKDTGLGAGSLRELGACVRAALAAAVAVWWAVFPVRSGAQVRAPELEPNLGWLNTQEPLRFDGALKGQVVLLDFWTSCCINCIHVLDDLEYLEEKYANEPFLVVGVHSSKFSNESQRGAIRSAMLRYGVRHPVVIDDGHGIWSRYTVRAWPTLVLVGADGKAIGMVSGEGHRETLDRAIGTALEEARAAGTLAAEPLRPKLDARPASASGLAFPGKVIADAKTGRVFIGDSGNNRVVVTTWPDASGMCSVVGVIGSTTGESGFVDGDGGRLGGGDARMHEPQGMAFDAETSTLYVADRRNHAIRAVEMAERPWSVRTLVGTGSQGFDRVGGKGGAEQALNSPWDVVLVPASAEDSKWLCVAMAGSHQLWSVELESGKARAIAGSGRENITDGPAGEAALAQPSGLAVVRDGSGVYFADSEVSGVRELNFGAGIATREGGADTAEGSGRKGGSVRTIIGTGLFDFGDVDGAYPEAKLQHCLGVTVLPGAEAGADRLLVADTFNHKIKVVDPVGRTSRTWGPGGDAMAGDGGGDGGGAGPKGKNVPLRLDEPGGVYAARTAGDTVRVFVADTNNHRVVVIDPESLAWSELTISGMDSLGAATKESGLIEIPEGALRRDVSVRPGVSATLSLNVALGEGRTVNAESPLGVRVTKLGPVTGSAIDLSSGRMRAERVVSQTTMRVDRLPVRVELPAEFVEAGAAFLVEMLFSACEHGDAAVCVPVDAAWVVSISTGEESTAELTADARGG